MMKFSFKLFFIVIFSTLCGTVTAQSFRERYQNFKHQVVENYTSFRDECNKKYADFLRSKWEEYNKEAPIPQPKDETPVPPKPYIEEDKETPPVEIIPVEIEPVKEIPQPKPIEPVKEVPTPDKGYFSFEFYGVPCKVRLPESAKLDLKNCSSDAIARGWELLSDQRMNNALRDCLETRIRYNLCDWAYLLFLDELSKKFCGETDAATLLMAYLYCQSGYQMRLAVDDGRLVMLYGSRHQIFEKPYFNIGQSIFYPWGKSSNSLNICDAAFEGETPMSLYINNEQALGEQLSQERSIKSRKYSDVNVTSRVPEALIEFYNTYPTSSVGGNLMTRWAMYANAPLAERTKEQLYPTLKESVKDLSEADAANKLLNWVQTGLNYEYDEKIWGHDRAFFAEESLYYPYCDCEDRSILFSRLVRDLLKLDVALIYYPGHLATAVCFNEDVKGDAMTINGRRFIVCDPTYIGAPVGTQMPGMEYDKAQAIVLNR